jgi:hypothetical protein
MMGLTYPRLEQIVALSLIIGATMTYQVAAQETAKELLAIQIRDQGKRCDTPVSAKRDTKHSKADVTVWVLRCETRSYRMTLTPDMAARVQRLN